MATIGELRQQLLEAGARWSVREDLRDSDPLLCYSLGGDDAVPRRPARDVPDLDFKTSFQRDPGPAHLFSRRRERRLLPDDLGQLHAEYALPEDATVPIGTAAPARPVTRSIHSPRKIARRVSFRPSRSR